MTVVAVWLLLIVVCCADISRKKLSPLYRVARGVTVLGATSNMLAVSLNNQRMPVKSFSATQMVIDTWGSVHIAHDSSHSVLNATTRLPWLCDIWNIWIGMCSLGDLLMAGGVLAAFAISAYRIIRSRRERATESEAAQVHLSETVIPEIGEMNFEPANDRIEIPI